MFALKRQETYCMDPQQRHLLVCCVDCLNTDGFGPESHSIGVFIGIMWNDYAHLLRLTEWKNHAYSSTGNGFAFLASRPSFTFGMQGPSVALDTACSSSMVSTELACSNMKDLQCVSALSGGVQCMLILETFTTLASLRAIASDGRCKTLDAGADGYGRGEAFGLLRIQKVTDQKQSKQIFFLLACMVNQDGRSSSFNCTKWAESAKTDTLSSESYW